MLRGWAAEWNKPLDEVRHRVLEDTRFHDRRDVSAWNAFISMKAMEGYTGEHSYGWKA